MVSAEPRQTPTIVTSTNAMACPCASALLAKEPRCDNVLSGMALLLADLTSHEVVGLIPARQ